MRSQPLASPPAAPPLGGRKLLTESRAKRPDDRCFFARAPSDRRRAPVQYIGGTLRRRTSGRRRCDNYGRRRGFCPSHYRPSSTTVRRSVGGVSRTARRSINRSGRRRARREEGRRRRHGRVVGDVAPGASSSLARVSHFRHRVPIESVRRPSMADPGIFETRVVAYGSKHLAGSRDAAADGTGGADFSFLGECL